MNARKHPWQILHAEIRRQASDDTDDEGDDLHPELRNIALLFKRACEQGVSELDIISELAGFGVAYALMARTGNDPLGVAREIEMAVMTESDETDDWKDDMREFKKWAEEHPLIDPDGDEDG